MQQNSSFQILHVLQLTGMSNGSASAPPDNKLEILETKKVAGTTLFAANHFSQKNIFS